MEQEHKPDLPDIATGPDMRDVELGGLIDGELLAPAVSLPDVKAPAGVKTLRNPNGAGRPKTKKGSKLREEILAGLEESELGEWQIQLCQHVVDKFHDNTRALWEENHVTAEFIRRAEALAQRKVKRQELLDLIRSRAWRARWDREAKLARRHFAKDKLHHIAPKAFDVAEESMKLIDRVIRGKDEVETKLAAVRAGAPIVTRIIDQAAGRNTQQSSMHAQVINITMTQEQAKGLDAPDYEVIAEEVPPKQLTSGSAA